MTLRLVNAEWEEERARIKATFEETRIIPGEYTTVNGQIITVPTPVSSEVDRYYSCADQDEYLRTLQMLQDVVF